MNFQHTQEMRENSGIFPLLLWTFQCEWERTGDMEEERNFHTGGEKWIPHDQAKSSTRWRNFSIEIFTSHSPIALRHSINRNTSEPFASIDDSLHTIRLQLTRKSQNFQQLRDLFPSSLIYFTSSRRGKTFFIPSTKLENVAFPARTRHFPSVLKRNRYTHQSSVCNVTKNPIHALFPSFQLRKLMRVAISSGSFFQSESELCVDKADVMKMRCEMCVKFFIHNRALAGNRRELLFPQRTNIFSETRHRRVCGGGCDVTWVI